MTKVWMWCAVGLMVAAVALPQKRSEAGALNVPAGGNLQEALDNARPGDTIYLDPGQTYVGNFVLKARGATDSRPITVRTAGADAVAPGVRMTPDKASGLAKLRSPNGSPALSTEPSARGWRVELVEFLSNRGGAGDMIALGDGSTAQKVVAAVPMDITLDRLYLHGDEGVGQKRAIALNAARVTISNSYIANIRIAGQDSQAIAGWNGPGGYVIDNNFLEAGSENVLFGGSDPAILELTPTDITIRRNTISKPAAWHQPGMNWQVKNLLELKNARKVLIEDNVFERNWSQAQSGYAILFTVRNQDGGCPWCAVEDVRFHRNTVRDVAAGFSILGTDDTHPSRRTTGIEISENLIDGLDGKAWGGDGYLMQILGGPKDVTVDHNTVIQTNSGGIAKIDGTVDGFVFTNNIVANGAYGIIATERAPGNDSIRNNLPGARIASNVIAGGNGSIYPSGNQFPSMNDFRRQFIDFAGHDFRLLADSPWMKAGSDGRPLGADLRARMRVPGRAATLP